jgi:probable rRNA maturation factor
MIKFYAADVSNPLKDRLAVKAWLQEVAKQGQHELVSLSYIFCSDDFLLEMNKEHLQHDYYTDIITFPIEVNAGEVYGECYISIDRVRDNAKEIRSSFADELHRVMVHGLWHLMGQGDKSPAEEAAMRKKEDESLAMRMFHVEQSKNQGQ